MMRNKKIFLSLLAAGLFLFLVTEGYTEVPFNDPGLISFAKPAQGRTTRALSNINNWSYWQILGGRSGNDPQGNSGGIYPRATGGVVFTDGLVWGGIIDRAGTPTIHVGGVTYNVGTVAGHIQEDGTASDANLAAIYKIRSDWRTLAAGQVKQEAAEIFQVDPDAVTDAQTDELIAQYKADWINWPVELGAPYVDVNDNGIYDPVLDADGAATTAGDHPGIASADQVLWYVNNDLDASQTAYLYGSDPMGVELQVTMWGYNQPNARLGQIIFKKYTFINKSNDVFDSMYVAQWCDPDVGTYTNDVVGCDSVVGLGFAYNGEATDGEFDVFGIAPPAMGYDFFQGPLVEGIAGQDKNLNGVDDAEDYGIFNLKVVGPGLINLPMTSFGYFSAGNTQWDDPTLQDYEGTLMWYNLLRGYITLDDVINPTPFTHRATGKATLWPLNGDPVAGTGDIDGQGANFAPADRRMSLNSGPFVMQPGDTQEVVVAMLGGISDSYLNSVADLKLTDEIAQTVYNDLFQSIPKPPSSPNVQAFADEAGIVLNWGWDTASKNAIENTVIAGYEFEGYNVYQLPSSSAGKSSAVRIATFDIANNGVTTIYGNVFDPKYGEVIRVPVQFGNDLGIERYLVVDKDYINNRALFPGNTYYYAVTAYNYNGDPQLIEDEALESSLLILTVRTQSPPPGVRYEGQPGGEIAVDHAEGSSDGQVSITIVDPAASNAQDYEIFFTENTDSTIAPVGEILWNLRRTSGTPSVLLTNQRQVAQLTDRGGSIADGVNIKVAGPPNDWKKFECVANAAGPIDPPEIGCFAFNDNGFPFLFNDLYPEGTDRPDGARQQTNGSTWGLATGGTGEHRGLYTSDDGEGFLERSMRSGWDLVVPWDFEMRFTAAGGYGNWWYENEETYRVPFELWNIGSNTPDDDSDDFRLIPFVLNDLGDASAGDTVYNINASDHAVSGGDNDPYMDWVYWVQPEDNSAGTAGYDAFVTAGLSGNYHGEGEEIMARTVLVNWNGGSVADPTFPANVDAVIPEEGTIFRFSSTKPNTVNDVFAFSTKQVLMSKDDALADVDRITVYPNPYYAFNPQEPDRFTRFVTFYHLPPRNSSEGNPYASETIIRIFDLGGALVRKLEKTDNSQFLRWDLRNEADLPVASGVYIAHIDMPDLGAEKILKLFVVQSAQIIKYY
ncbi:MAG: hypothetical protein JSW33_06790 [bacterium]|nr:MAG: hypothetical protein JSW33_06790 [bacterium]